MEVQRRSRGGRTYYYLVHSYRDGRRVRKVERYLGPKLPVNLDKLNEEILVELFSRGYGARADGAGRTYRKAVQSTPSTIRTKHLLDFSTRFTYDSNRIEGSTLTLKDTAALLEDGITPSNRPFSDVQETLAHKDVFLRAIDERGPLSLSMILDWHQRLFGMTKPEIAGKVRTYPVRISQSKFIPPDPFELDLLLTEFFDWHKVALKAMHPVLRAALVHLRLVSIHPFGDGNGRVIRIAMNRELRAARFPLFDIPYSGRRSYYNALERSQIHKNEVPFVRWFAKRYLAQTTRPVGM